MEAYKNKGSFKNLLSSHEPTDFYSKFVRHNEQLQKESQSRVIPLHLQKNSRKNLIEKLLIPVRAKEAPAVVKP